MRRREVRKLEVGTYVRLKHNLGSGSITHIEMWYTKNSPRCAPRNGRYPMIQYRDEVTKSKVWATYIAIESYYTTRRIAQ